jgi:predicted MFS family arabinose efflux permease
VVTPPVGASLRTVLPELLPDPAAVRAAYAVDASASELTWILGPPLVLGLGAAWSTGGALAIAGVMLAAATAAFAAQPASRGWRPTHAGPRQRGGALQTPAMRTLVTILVGVGVLFGAVEVAVTAASETLGHTTAAGPLLALWGAGSLVGGMLVIRVGARAHQVAGLTLMLAAMTLGHLLLTAAAGSILGLGAVLLVAGAAIAPTYAIVYAMVDEAAPAGTATEAFAWLVTAVAIGAAAGSAAAGSLVDQAGPAAAFGLAAAAGAAALAAAMMRAATLTTRTRAIAPATA